MIRTAYIIGALFILISQGCIDSEQAVSFRLRFIEHTTQNPIPKTKFILIPRKILLKIGKDYRDGNPNLQFAETITTDKNGIVSVAKTQLDNLTLHGKVVVDCESDRYSRFLIQRNRDTQEKDIHYYISVFSASSVVAGHITLQYREDNIVSLEKKTSSNQRLEPMPKGVAHP